MSENSQLITELASVHLGKASDGKTVQPYVTPRAVDASLLVAIPRHLQRTGLVSWGVGVDVWHAYEFSTMIGNEYVSGMLKLTYPSTSPKLVESKSLKLYLNSYNFDRFESIRAAEERVQRDLSAALGEPRTTVAIHVYQDVPGLTAPSQFALTSDAAATWHLLSADFPATRPRRGPVPRRGPHGYVSHALRSNCRVTNQPDWGSVFIYFPIEPPTTWTPADLYNLIISMRDKNHFHEEITEQLFDQITRNCDEEVVIACLYARRGGIDICPVRSTSDEFIFTFGAPLTLSTTFRYQRAPAQ